jgi:hypothetical protein
MEKTQSNAKKNKKEKPQIDSDIVKQKKTRKKNVDKNTEGKNTEGDNTEGDNTEGKNTEGDNTEGKNTEGKNTEEQCKPHCEEEEEDKQTKHPKKRGRKPKGGKIVVTSGLLHNQIISDPNIILHLKCGKMDLKKSNDILTSIKYDPVIENVENYQFDKNKGSELNFFVISENVSNIQTTSFEPTTSSLPIVTTNVNTNDETTKNQKISNDVYEGETTENKMIWKKIQKLSINLHNNNINDKKSACFWCTCDFDNPPIYIPKYELNDTYHCYGCFCSPECATASLFKEPIDTSSKFERYHLINHIYCKIYNYKKNVKPAPDPYYTLNKYYGNLTIQEYRKLLKNDRLILIVDKPFTRSLPELHEDNDDFILSNKMISTSSNKYKMKQKPSKSTLLSENFNMNK